jgi:ADP-ribosylglycohydrolase
MPQEQTMKPDAAAAVWGGLTADALALGAHWIYDTAQIDSQVGRVDRLMAPPPTSFHKNKRAGEFTHYGDQTMVLLTSLAEAGEFRLEAFAADWRALFADYRGYFDHATKDTLKHFKEGRSPRESGSASTDLSAVGRIAPLACLYADDTEQLVQAARDQTAMTHNTADVVDSAAFFAQTLALVLDGQTPLEALQTVQNDHFARAPFDRWVAAGIESAREPTRAAIRRFGQMCDVGAGFPGVVHLIAAHENHLEEALIANVMAGGDSAARGLLVGTILGASAGLEGIPAHWRNGLVNRERIRKSIDRLAACGG